MTAHRRFGTTSGSLAPWATSFLRLLRAFLRGGGTMPRLDAGELGDMEPHLVELRRRYVDGLYYILGARDSEWQRLYDRVWALQRAALAEAVAALADERVPVLVFKGAELMARGFGERSVGLLHDLDLLVGPNYLGRAKRVLGQLGYVQGAFDPVRNDWNEYDVFDLARGELTHYELRPFSRVVAVTLSPDELRAAAALPAAAPLLLDGDRAFVRIKIDVHHGVGAGIDAAQFFARAKPSRFAPALTFSPADHLWFTIRRRYAEVVQGARRRLRPFVYAAALLRQNEVDWTDLVSIVHHNDVAAPLFYWLTFLDRVGGGGLVPQPVLEELSPGAGSRSADCGWQLSTLFDAVDPFPLPLPISGDW